MRPDNEPAPERGDQCLCVRARLVICKDGRRRGFKETYWGPASGEFLGKLLGALIRELDPLRDLDPAAEPVRLGEVYLSLQGFTDTAYRTAEDPPHEKGE